MTEKIEDTILLKDETKGTITYETELDVDEEEVKNMAEASDSMTEEEVRKMLTQDRTKKVRPIYLDKSAFSDPENPPKRFKMTLEEV